MGVRRLYANHHIGSFDPPQTYLTAIKSFRAGVF